MPRQASTANQPQGPDAYLRAVRDTGHTLRDEYMDDPIALAERFGLKFPEKPAIVMQRLGVYDEEVHGPIEPGIRDLITDVCLGLVRSAAVVGPRGGGKSQGVSFIEFYLVFIKLFDALNLGGSELQADQVYSYLVAYITSDPYWKTLVKGETLQSKTETVDNAWIRVLTASQKSVRSPHAGGRKPGGRYAGGILVIDEEVEADAGVVEAALPTINTARPSVNVRCSTFHRAEGTFEDLIDNHASMGYKLYRWDIFDVAERCTTCTGGTCQSEEKCFREDHWDKVEDPDTGAVVDSLVHKAYCAGRAQYADGWVPMEEIHTMWARFKRNHARWEVEAMGSRPTASGHVMKDRLAIAFNTCPGSAKGLFQFGFPVYVCVDWGSTHAAVEVWQDQADEHVLLHADLMGENTTSEILGRAIGYYNQYLPWTVEIRADIGGGGDYHNPTLRERGFVVVDVNFGEDKEAAVAAWNIYNEAHKCTYPEEFEDFLDQLKKWKRQNGRIVKKNDHLCDAGVCYFSRFIDVMGLDHIRVAAKAARTGPGGPTSPASSHESIPTTSGGARSGEPPRVALVRAIGPR